MLLNSFCRRACVALVMVGLASRGAFGVDVWMTTGDKSQLLAQRPDVVFLPGLGSGGTVISVNPQTKYQTVTGYGAAMTDSAAWLLQNRMNASQREKLMRQLFSAADGIGLNYVRVPMGASDFTASGFYSYNDNPPGSVDPLQDHFSVAHDEAYVIPRLQEARQLNGDLKLMATPWSAPAWMKTNQSLLGGSLMASLEESYAIYLAKFIKAYEAVGLPIDAITLQNEPLHTSNYPTMSMSATQQIRLIKNHVGPRFASEGITTKIVAYDHNWDNTAFPLQVLADADARQFIAGTAFHAYAGNVTAQSTVHNAYPDKDIYFTEITGGDWAPDFADNVVWNFRNIIISGARNWSKSAILWNLALDENNGPHQGGCSDCRGVVTVDSQTGEVTYNEEFYTLGQVTKGVDANAVRISSPTTSQLETVAFLNPDGSQSLIALNPNAASTTIRVYQNGEHFNYQIPGKSVATFRWDAQGADFDNGGFDDGAFHLGGGSLDAWTSFGNLNGNVRVASKAVLEGEKSLKLSGQFSGMPNESGVFQGVTVAPGEYVHASLSQFVRATEGLENSDNVVQVKIEFYNEYGATRGSEHFLGGLTATIADAATPSEAWGSSELGGVAPPGSVEARLVIQFLQPSGLEGSVYVDSVVFGVTELPGDFDHNGRADGSDLLAWRQAFGIDASADADGDGDSDGNDFLLWQRYSNAATQNLARLAVPEPPLSPIIWAAGAMLRCLTRTFE